MTTFNAREFVESYCFSDLQKDTCGFRPGQAQYARWYAMSETELQAEYDYMLVQLDREMAAEDARKAAATVAFEATVLTLINCGAGTREVAIQWLCDAEESNSEAQFYRDFG